MQHELPVSPYIAGFLLKFILLMFVCDQEIIQDLWNLFYTHAKGELNSGGGIYIYVVPPTKILAHLLSTAHPSQTAPLYMKSKIRIIITLDSLKGFRSRLCHNFTNAVIPPLTYEQQSKVYGYIDFAAKLLIRPSI